MFTVYSKDNCKYCRAVEELFNMKDLPFTMYKLDEDFTRDQFIAEFGEESTFPRVRDYEGQLIGGAKETLIYLKDRGIM